MAVRAPADPESVAPIPAPAPSPLRRSRRGSGRGGRVETILGWLNSGAWTEEAYFALPETNHIIELSDGNLLVHAMPTLEHQLASSYAFQRLAGWSAGRQAGIA